MWKFRGRGSIFLWACLKNILTLYDLEIYMIDRAWFMINFGESHIPLAPPIIEMWIFENLKIQTLKSNNSRSIIVRIFWFVYYCSSGVSEQESINKKVTQICLYENWTLYTLVGRIFSLAWSWSIIVSHGTRVFMWTSTHSNLFHLYFYKLLMSKSYT
jgi:hypothetical protein